MERSFGPAKLCETLLTEILTPEIMEEYFLPLRTNLLLHACPLGETVRLSVAEGREPGGLGARQEA
jgi:hypothetical protein